jgi:uncharacterized protein YjbJ (UPF0337 family)
METEVLQANWSKVRGQIEKQWEQLHVDDLDRFEGNMDALIGEIQRQTGESREVIEHYLEQFTAETTSAVGRAGEAVERYASRAAGAVTAVPGRLAAGARNTYAGTQRTVRRRPVRSLAVSFTVGLLAGLAICLSVRSR